MWGEAQAPLPGTSPNPAGIDLSWRNSEGLRSSQSLGGWGPQYPPCSPQGSEEIPPLLTKEQLMEKLLGLMVWSWYSILQTMITHVQTVQTLEARRRSLAYGRAKAQEIKNT